MLGEVTSTLQVGQCPASRQKHHKKDYGHGHRFDRFKDKHRARPVTLGLKRLRRQIQEKLVLTPGFDIDWGKFQIHPDVKVSAYVETRRKLHGTLCIQEVKQVSASMSTSQWDALCRSAILRSIKVPFSSAKFSESPSGRVYTVISKKVKIYINVC